ncbi:MAG: DUF4230 domain-containing protein [Prevotella sp.]|nr:DUF4230 domain-containing protein [Prevotella sp.]
MKHIPLYLLLLLLVAACKSDKTDEKPREPQLPELVMQIQKQSRLYSTECHVHKIISHNDTRQLQGSILNQDFSFDLPLGKRSVAIPVEATVRAFIDFSTFSTDNVKRNGDQIEIILPDPKLEITSTRINHEEVKQYVPLLRKNFSDEELTKLEHTGREAIVKELPKLNLTETARQNAARTLIPLIADMGFPTDNITITFRKQFSASDLPAMLLKNEVQ